MTRLDELKIFSECCREVLLTKFKGNDKASKLIKESTGFEVCHLLMTGKFPKNYSVETKQSLMESVVKITSLKNFLLEYTAEELQAIRNRSIPVDNFKFGGNNISQQQQQQQLNSDGISDKLGQGLSAVQQGVSNFSNKAIDAYKSNQVISNDKNHPLHPYNDTLKDPQDLSGKVKNYFGAGEYDAHDRYNNATKDLQSQVDAMPHSQQHVDTINSQNRDQFQDLSNQQHGHAVIGGVALAAASIYGAYKLYKYFVNKNVQKAAAGKPPAQAAVAVKQVKQKATQLQITALQKSLGKCKTSKNPQQCQKTVAERIVKLKAKLNR